MYIKSLKIETESTTRLGNRLWALTDSLTFELEGITYTIPRGFVTDGASCPRVLWSICAPVAGPFGLGSIVHDWIYTDGPNISQYVGDCILYTSGRNRKAGYMRSLAVFYGVHWFGKRNYKVDISLNKATVDSCYDYPVALNIIKQLRGSTYYDY